MTELWKDRNTGWAAPLNEWFSSPYYDRSKTTFSEWKEKNLISLWSEEVRFALSLGMVIILGQNKVPLAGTRFKGRDYLPPSEIVILDAMRKDHCMMAAEMGRSNMICLDYDEKLNEKHMTYPFLDKTLVNETPHGNHLFFWNDVFHVRIPKLSSYQGPPLSIGKSKWLKEWMRDNPALLDALISETDITRIRNEIAWIPPSESQSGIYRWREPRRLPMLFSELLISLSKGRRRQL